MHEYVKIYEFAASLGAFEGYVYGKQSVDELDLKALDNWSGNIVSAYHHLSLAIRDELQAHCDQTAGRAIRSIEPVLGIHHTITQRLYAVITPNLPLPESADAFNKRKWFTHESS